jgi:hypothetical protein
MTAWRVGDAVAFEQMRQLSALVVSRLILDDPARALEVRRQSLLVDGFDRTAIDRRSRELVALLQEVWG